MSHLGRDWQVTRSLLKKYSFRPGKSFAILLARWSFRRHSAAPGAGRSPGCWGCSPWPPPSCWSSSSSATSPTAWPSLPTASTCSATSLPWWDKEVLTFILKCCAGYCLCQHHNESKGMEQEYIWLGKSWGDNFCQNNFDFLFKFKTTPQKVWKVQK